MGYQNVINNLRKRSSIKKIARGTNMSEVRCAAVLLRSAFSVLWESAVMIAMERKLIDRRVFVPYDHINELPDDHFKRLYRVTKDQFDILLDLVSPELQRQKRKNSEFRRAVPPAISLFITLRLLAGASYLDVSWPYGVARSTVFTLFDQCLFALNSALGKIRFPVSEEECHIAARRFKMERKSPFYGVISALDGLAVKIVQPKNVPDPRKYFNRKSFFAVVVQAACTADHKFSFVSARHAGSTHDSTAFQATALHRVVNENVLPRWAIVVGDDAYSHTGNMLCPYSGRGLSAIEDSFNYYQSSCRIFIEQAFGMLVGRWGIFWSAIKYPLEKVTLIIMVCCKLHNFIIDNADENDCDKNYRVPVHYLNRVQGHEEIFFQQDHHTEEEVLEERDGDNEEFRARIAQKIFHMGYTRTNRPQ